MRKNKFFLDFISGSGEKISFPIGVIEGAKPGPTIAIVAGVHGAECCGIAAAIDLFNYLQPEQINGKVIICTCFNKGAFEEHRPFIVPQDGKSPLLGDCRTLPENATYSEYMTHFFQTKVLDGIDYFIELHGGDVPEDLYDFVMYTVTGNAEVDKKSEQLALAYDIPIVLKLPVTNPNMPGAKVLQASFSLLPTLGIPSLLAEAGQFGLYDPKHAATHLKGLKNVLSSIGILNEAMIKTTEQVHVKYLGSMRSPLNGLWYPYKAMGEIMRKDEVVGRIADYFGETMLEITAPFDGKIVAMRNNLYVNIGQAMYYLMETEE